MCRCRHCFSLPIGLMIAGALDVVRHWNKKSWYVDQWKHSSLRGERISNVSGLHDYLAAKLFLICLIICSLCYGVVVQRLIACWLIAGKTGASAAWDVAQASDDEFDASCRLRSTAGDLVPATRSRKPSVKAPAARSLVLPTDLMNSEVSLCIHPNQWSGLLINC